MCQLGSSEELNNINFCIKDYCQKLFLKKSEVKDVEYLIKSIDTERIAVIAEDSQRVKHVYLDLNVLKIPELYITDFKPNAVNFNDNAEVVFIINSDVQMKGLELEFEDGNKLIIGDFKGSKEISVRTNGRSLVKGLKFQVKYKDENNKLYEKKEAFPVDIKNIPWYAKIILSILDLF